MKDPDEILSRILALAETLFPKMRDERARAKLKGFVSEQIEWGSKMHIVAKGSFVDSLERQVSDSLHILSFAARQGALAEGTDPEKRNVRTADIGSGYGFPGIVWKIICPEIDITLFERKEKAALLLERMIRKLDLSGIRVKGEAKAGTGGEPFGLVVSKAAGRLSSLLPLAEGLLTPSGSYVTIKGADWEWELGDYSGTMRAAASEPLEENRGTLLLFRREEAEGRRAVSRETV
ncbi:MAG: class I SAM-dependent methyltransferase [Candidatus Krumholzibacteriota bacterium]|nr:class I SAM-dependent methyltransferase [Candidatus Krumholzibacteriota bacterium]